MTHRWDYTATGVKKIRALCEDGKERTAYVTKDADTFFSTPCRVIVYDAERHANVTVSGFVLYSSLTDSLHFVAYSYRKNWRLVAATKKGTSQ
jgi:hypothetical protein